MTGSFRYDERKSGLVRQLSAFDVFLINTFGYALGVAVTINPVFIGGFAPSSNIYLVLALGLAAALSNGFTYGLFSAMMPKTGGDYVYVTRTLGPLIGFIASVGFTIAQIYGLSLDSTCAITQALSPSLTTYGMVTGNPRLIGISSFLTDNTHALFISVGFMLLLLFVSFLGLRFTKRLFIVVFAFAMLGTVLQAYAFFSVDQGQFRSLFDNFMRSVHMNTISYADVISIGQKGGMGFDRTRMLAESFRALPLGFLMFLGFTYSVYMGSEVKEAGRSQLVGIFSA